MTGNATPPLFLRPDVSVATVATRDDETSEVIIYWDHGSQFARCAIPSYSALELSELVGGQTAISSSFSATAPELLAFLRDRTLLTQFRTPRTGRYSRQLALWLALAPAVDPGIAQKRLSAARVAVVGLGGVGSNVVAAMAAAGVRHWFLVDPDVVEVSNLNRQMPYLFAGSIGQPKSGALAAYLEHASSDGEAPSVVARTMTTAEVAPELVSWRPDLIVMAADEPSPLANITALLAAGASAPVLVGGGYMGQSSFAGPLLLQEDQGCEPCLAAWFGGASVTQQHQRATGNLATVALSASSISSHCAIGLLTRGPDVDWPLRRAIAHLDLFELTMETRRLPSCDHKDAV